MKLLDWLWHAAGRLGSPRRRRMKEIMKAEIAMENIKRDWDRVAAMTGDDNFRWEARYRAAAAEQIRGLAREAWKAEYYHDQEKASELLERCKEVHARTRQRLGVDLDRVIVS